MAQVKPSAPLIATHNFFLLEEAENKEQSPANFLQCSHIDYVCDKYQKFACNTAALNQRHRHKILKFLEKWCARSNNSKGTTAPFELGRMVRSRRLELPRELPHSDLNAARLPIPPRPHMTWWRGITRSPSACEEGKRKIKAVGAGYLWPWVQAPIVVLFGV
jgi:hypothetical protein